MARKCHKHTTYQPMAPPGRGTEHQQPSGNNKKIKSKATSYLFLPQRGNCKTRKEIHIPMHTRSSDPYVSSLSEQSVPHRYPSGISVTDTRLATRGRLLMRDNLHATFLAHDCSLSKRMLNCSNSQESFQ